MLKCFEGIKSLTLSDTLEVTGMISPEGEEVTFINTVQTMEHSETVRNVETWMSEVETEMKATLATLT
jgi:hypothetical protein